MNTNPSFLFRSWLVLCILSGLIPGLASAQSDCSSFTAGADITTTRQVYKLGNAPTGATWSAQPANPARAVIDATTGQVTSMTAPGTYRFALNRPATTITTGNSRYAFTPGDETKFGPVLSNSFSGPEYLNNGKIKMGVDYKFGGAITFLSTATGPNVVNNYDHGRQFQIAVYDGPTPYLPPGVDYIPQWIGLGYNPIQAGDAYGNKAEVVAFERRENLIYVKTIAKQFALRNYPGEVYIEHWLRLSGNAVKVHARVTMFRTDDKTQYQARDQEFPCMYLNGPYHNIWGYQGNQPFTNGNLHREAPPMNFENIDITEQWMAATDNTGFGAALYVPGNYFWRKGYFGTDYAGDERSADASYIGATWFQQLDHNSVSEWDYEFVVGNVNDMRSYITTQALAKPDTGPNYRFDNDRKGWFLSEANDTGWPILGKLDVKLQSGRQNQIKSPGVFWRGKDNPKVYIRAAFQTQNDKYQFFWRRWDDYEFLPMPSRIYDFAVQNDGQFHTYELDMKGKSGWTDGDIRQILLQPLPGAANKDGSMKVEWISTSPNGPPTTQTTTPTVTAACSSTVSITVAPQPNAGPDRVLSCSGTTAPTTAQLPAAPGGMTWRVSGQPAKAAATVTNGGALGGLTQPGTYTLTLTNDDFGTFSDAMIVTVPSCQSRTVSLGYFVFADNGAGGGLSNDGRVNGTEGGLLNIALTIYTDPNRDGNPADGVVVGRGLTDSRGFNRFTGLTRGMAYLVGVDAANFTVGGPLAGFQRSAVSQQNPANGVNNGIVVSPVYGVLSSPIFIPVLPLVRTLAVDEEEVVVTFGFTPSPDCKVERCVPIKIRKL